jgi:hypothetical protein
MRYDFFRSDVLKTFALMTGLVFLPLSVHAESKTITAEATYLMGDGETPAFAEAMVLQKAKQIALEEAGTYVQSYTKIQNLDLTSDEIVSLAGSVLQTEILKRDRSLVGNGVRFDIKIKAIVTTDRMEDLARKLRGNDISEKYKKLQQQYAILMRELESIKSSLAQSSPGPKRDSALESIREHEKTFRAIQNDESTLIERFVSGDALFAKALSQVSQKEAERDIVDALSERLLNEGYIISLGEPSIEATLRNRDMVTIKVPVTVTVSPSIKAVVSKAALQLGGIAFAGYADDISRQTVLGSVVKLAGDVETFRRFQNTISKFALLVEANEDTGSHVSCYRSPEMGLNWSSFGIVTGTFIGTSFQPDRPELLRIADATKLQQWEGYVILYEQPVTFTAQLRLPLHAAKKITNLKGRMAVRELNNGYYDKCKVN